jgi:hypothetical protein
MKKGYWFVRLNEDAAPPLDKLKNKLLVFMKKLRSDLGEIVHLH